MAKGVDPLQPFFDAVERAVEYVVQQKLADPHKLGVMGLSRGGFIASHVAARDKRFRHILQFAPVTRLEKAKEFHALQGNPILQTLDLFSLAPRIADRNIRLYIGNNDTRVDTRSCFEFMMQLIQHAPTKFPPISLFINPSIGQYGHGTPSAIFREGANWLADCLSG
jgi:esterase FrsA